MFGVVDGDVHHAFIRVNSDGHLVAFHHKFSDLRVRRGEGALGVRAIRHKLDEGRQVGYGAESSGAFTDAMVLREYLCNEFQEAKIEVSYNLSQCLDAAHSEANVLASSPNAEQLRQDAIRSASRLAGGKALACIGKPADDALARLKRRVRDAGQYPEEYLIIANRAIAQLRRNASQKAVDLFQRALALRPVDVDILGALGNACRYAGELSLAAGYCELAVEHKPDADDIRRALVETQLDLGDYTAAEQWLEPLLSDTKTDLEAYLLAARIGSAEGYLEEALDLYDALLSTRVSRQARSALALLSAATEWTQDSASLVAQAILDDPVNDWLWRLLDDHGSHTDWKDFVLEEGSANCHPIVSWLAQQEGMRLFLSHPPASRSLLLESLRAVRSGRRKGALADAFVCLAELAQNDRHPLSSFHLAAMALDIAEDTGQISLSRRAHRALARACRTLERTEEALTHFETALQLSEDIGKRLVNLDSRAQYAEANADVYAEHVQLLLEMNRPHDALEWAERSKSRTLVELLGNHKIRLLEEASQELVDEYDRLRQELRRLELLVQVSQDEVEESEELEIDAARHEAQLREVRRHLQIVRRQISEGSEEWNSLRAVKHLPFKDAGRPEDLQRMLLTAFGQGPERVVVVSYYVTDQETIAFLIPCWESPDHDLLVRRLDLSADDLTAMVRDDLTQQIARREGRPWCLEQECSKLVEPLLPDLDRMGVTALVFAPHSQIHLLPLHACSLHDERGSQYYLIERYPCSYLPCLSLVSFLSAKRSALGGAFVLGNPDPPGDLKYAEAEACAVAEMLDTQAMVGGEATRAVLRDNCWEKRVIHLACHAVFDRSDGLQSHLLLADWPMLVDEIMGLSLQSSLVTLSACGSGLSEVSAGDELLGMTRGWLYAGTPTVIASLWSVDDRCAACCCRSL